MHEFWATRVFPFPQKTYISRPYCIDFGVLKFALLKFKDYNALVSLLLIGSSLLSNIAPNTSLGFKWVWPIVSYYLEILQLTYFLSWLHITKTTACKQPRWCLKQAIHTHSLCKNRNWPANVQGVFHKWSRQLLRGEGVKNQGKKSVVFLLGQFVLLKC